MKKKFLLITGGTGGHVLPAENLGNYLLEKKINCSILLDRRGYKYLNNFKGKVNLVESSNLNGGFLDKLFGLVRLFIGLIQSICLIIYLKPNKVISFGSYASFFPLLCCLILKPFYRIEIFIHEQNSIFGRTNKFFLYFSKKILLNFPINSKIIKKYKNKTFIVGNPTNDQKKIDRNKKNKLNQEFNIFILGGSQGSEYISNFSVKLIKEIIDDKIIKTNFTFQCPRKIFEEISNYLISLSSKIIIKEYFYNIDDIFSNTSVIISRAGAGSITNFINYEIPAILIPLPSSKDNHQFYNATIMSKQKVAIILDQNKNEINKAKNYIYEIYKNANDTKLMKKRFDKIKVKNSNSLIYKLVINEQ